MIVEKRLPDLKKLQEHPVPARGEPVLTRLIAVVPRVDAVDVPVGIPVLVDERPQPFPVLGAAEGDPSLSMHE